MERQQYFDCRTWQSSRRSRRKSASTDGLIILGRIRNWSMKYLGPYRVLLLLVSSRGETKWCFNVQRSAFSCLFPAKSRQVMLASWTAWVLETLVSLRI